MNVCTKLVILGLFCVKLSSGQGLVYRLTDLPTDMSKAMYPHFVEGGHNNSTSSGPVTPIIELMRDLQVIYILTIFGTNLLIFVDAKV